MKFEEDKAALEESRAALYHFLAAFYLNEPTPQLLDELDSAGFFDLSDKVGISFGGIDLQREEFFEELAVEYTRLFISHGQHVSPYASVHRTDDKYSGQLWGETTGEVKRFIEHYGLEISSPGLLPDHIGILFEFMSRLIQAGIESGSSAAGESARTSEEIQLRFFRDFVHPWIDRFIEKVEEADPAPFYRALVRLTAWFVEEERVRFQLSGAGDL